MWENGDPFAARYESLSSICFVEVLAMLLLRSYRKPPHSIVFVSVGVPAAPLARGVMETYRRYSAADNFRSGGRWPQN